VYCSIRNPLAYSEHKKQNETKRNETKRAMTELVEDKNWNNHYEKLVEFKRNNGNCLVPRGYQEDMSLGKWVDTQRQFHCKNTIRLDRKDLLNKLGFVWNVEAHRWNKQYEKLVEFKRKHGNCLVPRSYKEDTSLGEWVNWQRYSHIKNTIRLDRQGLLEEIGFVWRVDNSALWNKQYGKLFEFKRKNGHCLVPTKYPEDKSLGKWVDTQRQLHSKNTIRLDRKGLLDDIGFAWKAGGTVAARSSTKDVSCRCRFFSLFIQVIFLSLSLVFCF
jgi:uncharacterized protein YbgA (DUF1722 family)